MFILVKAKIRANGLFEVTNAEKHFTRLPL